MCTLITYYGSRKPKTTKDVFMQEFDYNSMTVCLGSYHLHPLRHIIYCQENILKPKWRWEGAHEINSPNIKDLYHKNRGHWHHITTRYRTHLLIAQTSSTKLMGIFKNCGPLKPALLNLGGRFMPTKMTATCRRMTKSKNAMHLTLRHTPSDHLVGAIFNLLQMLPKIIPDQRKESVLVLFRPILLHFPMAK